MLSYNCRNLLTSNNSELLHLLEQYISAIKSELLHIEFLLMESSSLNLSQEDLFYYQKELRAFYEDNQLFLSALTTFLFTIRIFSQNWSYWNKFTLASPNATKPLIVPLYILFNVWFSDSIIAFADSYLKSCINLI